MTTSHFESSPFTPEVPLTPNYDVLNKESLAAIDGMRYRLRFLHDVGISHADIAHIGQGAPVEVLDQEDLLDGLSQALSQRRQLQQDPGFASWFAEQEAMRPEQTK